MGAVITIWLYQECKISTQKILFNFIIKSGFRLHFAESHAWETLMSAMLKRMQQRQEIYLQQSDTKPFHQASGQQACSANQESVVDLLTGSNSPSFRGAQIQLCQHLVLPVLQDGTCYPTKQSYACPTLFCAFVTVADCSIAVYESNMCYS